jgi:hypothetical protein
MNAVLKYLAFVGVLAAASYATATLDVAASLPAIAGKSAPAERPTAVPSLSGKPSHLLGGLQGQTVFDYNPGKNLTAAAAGDTLKIWQLPDEKPQLDFDTGDDFQVLALRFVPAKGLLVAGGSSVDATTGGVRLFDVVTGKMVLQIDEPEPIIALDLHPGGGYLLATARTYLKVLALNDGSVVALLPKETPLAKGYFYGGGSLVLLSDSLATVDVNTQKRTGQLDTVPPLLVKKTNSSGRFAWLTADGLALQTAPAGKKELIPLQFKGITGFDVEPNGKWGAFLLEGQKLATFDASNGKIIKTVTLSAPAADVSLSPDGASAAVVFATGEIAIFDVGRKNTVKNIRFQMANAARYAGEKLSRLIAWAQR